MDELLNAVKRHVSGMLGQLGNTRIGVVTSVNPETYTARVRIQPEDQMTGWLPVAATMVGNGWGLVSPPSPGEQVAVLAQEGDSEHGVIIGRLFSSQQLPPQTYTDQTNQNARSKVQPGEVALVHRSGTFLRLIGDRVLINGDLYVNGTVHATGNVLSDADVADRHGSLDRLRQNYNPHVHGDSSGPTPTDPE